MKTSININLFGTVYAIDEDAHKLLDQYLTNLKSYFAKQQGGDEIADDIEHRIAELFWELKQQGCESISIEQVTEILHKIGNPEEMGEQATAEEPQQELQSKPEQPRQEEGGRTYGAAQSEGQRGSRRFFRDGRDKVLGGVLSGLCHYFGWNEPLLLRICFVLLCLFSDGLFVFLYLLIWLIAPKAVSAEERLKMKGQAVNPESIRSEVLNGAAVSSNTPESHHGGCLKVLLGMVLAPFGCVGAFVLFILAVVLFSLLFGLFGGLVGLATGGSAALLEILTAERGTILLLLICAILVIGLPIYGLYRWLRRDSRPMQSTTTIILAGLWLLAIIFGWYYGSDFKQKVSSLDWSSIVQDFDDSNWDLTVDDEDDDDAPRSYDLVMVDAFESIDFTGVGNVEFTQGDSCQVEVSGKEWLKKHTMVTVNNGVLLIELDDQAREGKNSSGLKFRVKAPYLTSVRVKGVGTFGIKGNLTQEQPINLNMEGVGKLTSDKITSPRITATQHGVGKTCLEVDTDSLIVTFEGVGKMQLSGRASNYQRNANEMLSVVDDEHLHIGN